MLKYTIFLALLLFSCTNYAQNKTLAVVVGISDYKVLNTWNGDLKFADNDALKFAKFLTTTKGGNLPASAIIFLRNEKATKNAILNALISFQKATPQDKIIFYFSGHGMENALVPYDAKIGETTSLLSFEDIKAAFKKSKATNKIIIADACYSGGITKRLNTNVEKEVEKSSTLKSNIVMILSSRVSQTSIEHKAIQGGVFTYFLLKGLNGNADSNNNAVVTVKELYNYMAERIKMTTPNHQAPVFFGRFSDNFSLSN